MPLVSSSFKELPLYKWELSTVLYTVLLETEFPFREMQLLPGFNLAIEREKCVTKLYWKLLEKRALTQSPFENNIQENFPFLQLCLTVDVILIQLLLFKICSDNEDCF